MVDFHSFFCLLTNKVKKLFRPQFHVKELQTKASERSIRNEDNIALKW